MKITENADLSKLCTFMIGGKAKYLIDWIETDELKQIVEFACEKNLPLFFFGGGTNLLFPDEDLEVIAVRCMTSQIQYSASGGYLVADAGVRWTKVQTFCKDEELFGLEGLYGVPGTIGGSAVGNAGCHGQEAKDVILNVMYFDLSTKELMAIDTNNCEFDYRTSKFKQNPNWIILKVWMKISDNPEMAHGDPKEFANYRKQSQPNGLTTGSFFKNPNDDYAGRLIEACGLKGHRIGDVSFSDKHANFVINHGKGTAKEVIELTTYAQNCVKEKFDIMLEAEVKIVNKDNFITVHLGC